ncbi:HTH_Tnp_Tc3_2 domain-containing protein [Trichonephila clavipes]|nr:HTH_Tnp_Tc3_2 domain-containing protein [Trichonephila clavipes]
MPRVRSRKAYQHISKFGKGRVVAYRNFACVRSIAARVDRDPMTVNRILHRWVPDGNTECCTRSQRPPITSSREDRQVTRMALMDHSAT